MNDLKEDRVATPPLFRVFIPEINAFYDRNDFFVRCDGIVGIYSLEQRRILWTNANRYILSRFTHTFDINQVPIYEGDIIRETRTDDIFLVEWNYGLLDQLQKFSWRSMQVIGNKWQNQKLLGGEDVS